MHFKKKKFTFVKVKLGIMRHLKHIFLSFIIVYQAFAAEDPRELFKFAKFKFDKSEYTEALDYLNQTISIDPKYSNAFLLRAEVYYNLKKFQLTIEDVDKALAIDTAYNSFLNKYIILKAKSYIALNDYAKAENVFSKLLSKDDYNAEAHYELANLQFIQDKPVDAILSVTKSIKIEPKNGTYYATRAYFTEKAYTVFPGDKNYQKINEDYNLAIYFEPGNYELYKMRSEFKRKMGQEVDALTDYNKMIEISPSQNYAYTERGVLKMHKENYTGAITDFNSSLEIDPQNASGFKYRGLCYHNMRKYYDAYQDFTKSIDILNGSGNGEESIKNQIAQTYLMRGHSLYAMGKGSEACVDFLKALDLGERKGLNYFRKYCRY